MDNIPVLRSAERQQLAAAHTGEQVAVGVESDETNYELRIGTNYAPALVLGRMDRARTGR
jgi:hypothetical protein